MKRILIVDDEIDTLNLLRMILELSGYQAFTTLNSVDAITLAEIERPDCILLDIMMPQLDGFTLCKMMRLHPSTAHLPIVFVTAYSALDLDDRRKEAGADMILPKPVGMDALIETVELAIQLRAAPPKAAPDDLGFGLAISGPARSAPASEVPRAAASTVAPAPNPPPKPAASTGESASMPVASETSKPFVPVTTPAVAPAANAVPKPSDSVTTPAPVTTPAVAPAANEVPRPSEPVAAPVPVTTPAVAPVANEAAKPSEPVAAPVPVTTPAEGRCKHLPVQNKKGGSKP